MNFLGFDYRIVEHFLARTARYGRFDFLSPCIETSLETSTELVRHQYCPSLPGGRSGLLWELTSEVVLARSRMRSVLAPC
jgi:hypothetical protein